jgi:AcrR family transcriptional regulator
MAPNALPSKPIVVEPRVGGRRAEMHARRREEVRGRLLTAAREAFESLGYTAVRVSDITERAEVSHGLFYNYFSSKAQIFRELAREIDAHLVQSMDAYLEAASSGTTRDRMRLAIRTNFRQFREYAPIMRVIAEAAHLDPEIAAARATLNRAEAQRLASAIRELQQEGNADPKIDPEIAAVALGAMGWRFSERWFLDGELDCELETGAEQFLNLVLNALGVGIRD